MVISVPPVFKQKKIKNALCVFFYIFCPEPKLLGSAYFLFYKIKNMTSTSFRLIQMFNITILIPHSSSKYSICHMSSNSLKLKHTTYNKDDLTWKYHGPYLQFYMF